MAQLGPVIYLEDDVDDQEILTEVFQSLQIPNELKLFSNGYEVLEYLRTTTEQPFIIITDVNLPVMSGLALREEICKDEYLRQKSIPYVFLSTSSGKNYIQQAYDLQVQGYFQKPHTFEALKITIAHIMEYWSLCMHPNNM